MVSVLEAAGASGIVVEDQARPRRCGHLDGKKLVGFEEQLSKLEAILTARNELFVIARTDASEPAEILRRARSYAELGADAVLADGLDRLDLVARLSDALDVPVVFNQMAGGKSPSCTFRELRECGASVVLFSTPCLFAAQRAVDDALGRLEEAEGFLNSDAPARNPLEDCLGLLEANRRRRADPSTESAGPRSEGRGRRMWRHHQMRRGH